MKSITNYLCCLMGLAVPVLFNACSHRTPLEQPPVLIQPDGYELFVKAHPKYPKTMEIYRNAELLKRATPDCPIYVCLSQQRGRLYVNGKVAADWPVSTGAGNRPTPTGSFRVLEKKKDYTSNTWGKIYDAEGKCINSNADSRTDSIPEGGKFVGSPMPNWHRMTNSGIGMHTGKVRAGRQLSHGCIRTPERIASELFKITATGRTRIIVSNKIEACYPTFVGTIEEQKARLAAATGKPLATEQNQPAPAEQSVVVPAPTASPMAQQQPAPAAQRPATPVAQQQPAPAAQRPATPMAQQQPAPAAQRPATPVAQQQPAPAAQRPATPVAQQQPAPAAQRPRTYTRSAAGVKVHFIPSPL